MEKLQANERDVWVAAYRGQLLRGDHIIGARVFADNAVEAARERGAFDDASFQDDAGAKGGLDVRKVLTDMQRFMERTSAYMPSNVMLANLRSYLGNHHPEALRAIDSWIADGMSGTVIGR